MSLGGGWVGSIMIKDRQALTVEIYVTVMGSCLFLFLRCPFRIIFILIRYVATIAMKAFYDEALRIAFKQCKDFQPVSIV